MAKKEPNPIDKHIGSRVRQARLIVGMSQEKLGDALNLTFQQVQKYEKGTNRIGGSRLQQIANAVGKPPAWFYEGQQGQGGEHKFNPDDPMAEFATSRERIELARDFMRLPADKQRCVARFIHDMAA